MSTSPSDRPSVNPSDLLTLKEAAALLGVPVAVARGYLLRGWLPWVRAGVRTFIRRSVGERFRDRPR